MTLLEDLRSNLDRCGVGQGRLVVAVSGGADSTALLHMLAEARPDLELVCVHVNHGLRGEESDRDAALVAEHARSLSIELRVVHAEPDAGLIRRRGLEAAARTIRYRALETIRDETGSQWIATGHTMDDQAETVLQKLIDGTPPETLSGILPVTTALVVRPLLGLRRRSVHAWISEREIEYRSDSSNADLRFLRNRVRLNLLPVLEQRDEHVVERLAAIAAHVQAIQTRIAPVRARAMELWFRETNRSAISVAALPMDHSLRRMILLDEIHRLSPEGREISSARLETLPEELRETGRVSLGDGIEARLADDVLVLDGVQEVAWMGAERTIGVGQRVSLPEIGAAVTLRRIDLAERFTDGPRHSQVFTLPHGSESPLFTLRRRLPGDRFQPLGMRRPKKLKDFLIDRKVPRDERDAIPLLVYEGEIVWIAGVEVSERFRVVPGRDLYEVRIDYEISATEEIR